MITKLFNKFIKNVLQYRFYVLLFIIVIIFIIHLHEFKNSWFAKFYNLVFNNNVNNRNNRNNNNNNRNNNNRNNNNDVIENFKGKGILNVNKDKLNGNVKSVSFKENDDIVYFNEQGFLSR
jgi:hypothetical protein